MSTKNPKGIDNLSDSFVSNLGKKKALKPLVTSPNKKVKTIKVSNLNELGGMGFKSHGTGVYKDAQHHLWNVERTSEGYSLVRNAEEDSDDSEDHSVIAGKKAYEGTPQKGEGRCHCGHDAKEHYRSQGGHNMCDVGQCPCKGFKPISKDDPRLEHGWWDEKKESSKTASETCACGHPEIEHDMEGCEDCKCPVFTPTAGKKADSKVKCKECGQEKTKAQMSGKICYDCKDEAGESSDKDAHCGLPDCPDEKHTEEDHPTKDKVIQHLKDTALDMFPSHAKESAEGDLTQCSKCQEIFPKSESVCPSCGAKHGRSENGDRDLESLTGDPFMGKESSEYNGDNNKKADYDFIHGKCTCGHDFLEHEKEGKAKCTKCDCPKPKLDWKKLKSHKIASKWTRLCQTDEQEQMLSVLEKTLSDLGVSIKGGITVGKEPQRLVLDLTHEGGEISLDAHGNLEINDERVKPDHHDEIKNILSEMGITMKDSKKAYGRGRSFGGDYHSWESAVSGEIVEDGGKYWRFTGKANWKSFTPGTLFGATYKSTNAGFTVDTFRGFSGSDVQYGEGGVLYSTAKEMYKAEGVKSLRQLEDNGKEYGFHVYMCIETSDGDEGCYYYPFEGRWCRGSGAEPLTFWTVEEMAKPEKYEDEEGGAFAPSEYSRGDLSKRDLVEGSKKALVNPAIERTPEDKEEIETTWGELPHQPLTEEEAEKFYEDAEDRKVMDPPSDEAKVEKDETPAEKKLPKAPKAFRKMTAGEYQESLPKMRDMWDNVFDENDRYDFLNLAGGSELDINKKFDQLPLSIQDELTASYFDFHKDMEEMDSDPSVMTQEESDTMGEQFSHMGSKKKADSEGMAQGVMDELASIEVSGDTDLINDAFDLIYDYLPDVASDSELYDAMLSMSPEDLDMLHGQMVEMQHKEGSADGAAPQPKMFSSKKAMMTKDVPDELAEYLYDIAFHTSDFDETEVDFKETDDGCVDVYLKAPEDDDLQKHTTMEPGEEDSAAFEQALELSRGKDDKEGSAEGLERDMYNRDYAPGEVKRSARESVEEIAETYINGNISYAKRWVGHSIKRFTELKNALREMGQEDLSSFDRIMSASKKTAIKPNEDVGSGKEPNKYVVTGTGDFFVESGPGMEWASGEMPDFDTNTSEDFGTFDTYPEAIRELDRQAEGNFGSEPEEGKINTIFIEDHISGIIFQYGFSAYKEDTKWHKGYTFELEPWDDTKFTSDRLGYDIRKEQPRSEESEEEE